MTKAMHLSMAAVACLAVVGMAAAQEVKLPPQLTVTAYDTGSSGFNITVAIGQQFKKYGTDVRVLPAGNDTSRLAPLRSGRAALSGMGIGSYFAQEGMFEFGTKEWGPQPLRMLLTSSSCNGITVAVAKDTGVKEFKDLKDKRVGVVVGSPALTQNILATLAFGNLTRSDVKLVEFSSYGAMWKGMLNNEVDAAVASTIAGQPKELETSPRGLVWPPMPKADKAAWDRLVRIGPYFVPTVATCGAAGISKTNPIEMTGYPYPIYVAYPSQTDELVYNVTKAFIEQYPNYKDAAPGADGMALDKQTLTWVLPYHAGAVKALKEAKVWTDAAEKHNQALIKRQDVLAAAWKAHVDSKPADDKFADGWMKVRGDALKKAGMDVVFDD
jgi:TRAP transporter TAXI family solute receptor